MFNTYAKWNYNFLSALSFIGLHVASIISLRSTARNVIYLNKSIQLLVRSDPEARKNSLQISGDFHFWGQGVVKLPTLDS